MKYTWAVVVLACMVVSAAFASGGLSITTARSLGMGNTVNAVADDAAAWWQNPAGLASLNVPVAEGKQWGSDIMGTYGQLKLQGYSTSQYGTGDDTLSGWALDFSTWQPEKRMGVGAGFTDEDGGQTFGAGFGMGIKELPLSVGISIERDNPDYGDGSTWINFGALYKFVQPEKAPIKVGLFVGDITDESNYGPIFDVGVLWPATPKINIAVDVDDITSQYDDGPFFSAGAEAVFGNRNEWVGRAGLMDDGSDTSLTLGVGYKAEKFRVDFGWADVEDGMFQISAAAPL